MAKRIELGRSLTYDDDNRVKTFQGTNVSYDNNGNLTSGPLTLLDGFASLTYDARNRLTVVGPEGAIPAVSYGYDSEGHRTSVTTGTNVATYVVHPVSALAEPLIRTQGGTNIYYIYGPGVGLLYQIDGTGAMKAYHLDPRGSTAVISDANGNVTDRVEYSPYGAVTHRTGSTDTPFLYNGRFGVMTEPNALLFMRSRYYSPLLCRFLNPDPSSFAGGLNFYAFANGNPINLMDPYGLCAVGDSGGTSWLSQLNLYGTMSDLAAAGCNHGGITGSAQANFYSGATALLNTIGAQAVGTTASPSGTAEGNGNTGAAIGWGAASVALIALNAYTGGQTGSALGNLGTYAANPIMYEIGSKTLPTTVYNALGLGGMSQIQKGAVITSQLYGGSAAAAFFTPVATTAYGTTISTGLTPGAAYLLSWTTQGVNVGADNASQYFDSSTGN